MINAQNYREASLEEYQKEIHAIWPPLASRPALHTWARVVQHGTTACEGMRRSDWALVLGEMAKTIVWWLAFIEKTNLLSSSAANNSEHDDDFVFALPVSATDLIWRKYPSVCPVEFGLAAATQKKFSWPERPAQRCRCLARKMDVEQRSAKQKSSAKELLQEFALQNQEHCPKSIQLLEEMFRKIFEGSIYSLPLEELFFHFIEEIGEVSEALANATYSEVLSQPTVNKQKLEGERKGKIRAIAEELADVFSWSVAIVAKVQSHLRSFEKHIESRADGKQLKIIRDALKGTQFISIPEIIWQKYGLRNGKLLCNDCNFRPCKCAEQRALPLYEYALRDVDEKRKHLLYEVSRNLTI